MAVHGDNFIDVYCEALKREYGSNRKEKGNSFLVSDMDFMYDKLAEEHQEVQDLRLPDLTDQTEARGPRIQHPSHDFMAELVDMGLVAAMCWWRENGQTTVHVPPPTRY